MVRTQLQAIGKRARAAQARIDVGSLGRWKNALRAVGAERERLEQRIQRTHVDAENNAPTALWAFFLRKEDRART